MPNFQIPIRIYMQDTDANGIVFHANYLNYAERARADWLRQIGLSKTELKQNHDLNFVVAQANLKFFSPAFLDDLISVNVMLTSLKRASLEITQQIHRDETLVADVWVKLAMVDSYGKPRPFPDTFTNKLNPLLNSGA